MRRPTGYAGALQWLVFKDHRDYLSDYVSAPLPFLNALTPKW